MSKKKPEEYITDIQEACSALGWHIALSDANNVQGLVIGLASYLKDTVSQLDDGKEYEIWTSSGVDDIEGIEYDEDDSGSTLH